MSLTEKELTKHFGHLEDHQYKGFNRALGCFVEGKEHFKFLMSKGGYVPFEKAARAVESAQHKNRRSYTLSPEATAFISNIRMMADSKGNIKLGDLAIKKMEELGVDFRRVDMENFDPTKGGFK